jgi:hypothetical protein
MTEQEANARLEAAGWDSEPTVTEVDFNWYEADSATVNGRGGERRQAFGATPQDAIEHLVASVEESAKLRDRWNRAHDLVHRFFPLVLRVIDAAKGEAEWPDGESADQSFTALSDEWDEIEKGVDPSELATDVATLRAEEARLREVIAQATSGLQRWCDGYYQGPSLTQILAILKEVSHD